MKRKNSHKKEEVKEMRHVLSFIFALVAGIFATVQGYQAVTANSITGNVIGVPLETGIGGIAVIIGMLIIVGSFLMAVNETRRFGGILTIVLGAMSAIVTLGATLIPSVVAATGGFLSVVAD